MAYYAGLDVSLKEVSICVVDADGTVVAEGKVATDSMLILSWIQERVGTVERIVHESGPLSIWLTRELARCGAPVVCIDARAAHKALSARMNKSDRADAEALAQLARTGWYRKVYIKSEASDRLRLLLGARERLIRVRQDIEAQARGVLKTYGIRLGAVTRGQNRAGFRDQFKIATAGDSILEAVATSLIAVHEVVCAEAAAIEDELMVLARDSELARRLMTVPGVGPIVSLNFIAAIDDVGRFARVSDVGAYLGLTPRRYQSGEIDYSGRISKRGNAAMRTLLFEAANILITRVRRFSPLKAWAVRLAARKGFKKAAVAAARKIAVVLLRLWRDGTTFAWTREAATA
jgi:transposase